MLTATFSTHSTIRSSVLCLYNDEKPISDVRKSHKLKIKPNIDLRSLQFNSLRIMIPLGV
jgi:hypothetical protein